MAARFRGLLVLSGVVATLLAGVIAAGSAAAQSATCTTPTATLTVSPTTAAAGSTLQVSASNYTPSVPVTFFDNGQQVGTNNGTDAQGSVSGPYTIPTTATNGQHTLVGSQTSGKCASATFTVTGGSGGGTTTGACPAGYVYSGTQCVVGGGGGVCPTGYYFDGTQCIAGSYPGTYNPGTYNTGLGGCPPGYVNIGYACQPGPYASAYCPPTGTYPPGSGCAAAQGAYGSTPYATTATTVVQSAPQTVASGRVAYTGSRTVRSVAYGLALLIGGLVLLSARAVLAPFRR
jgi:hypothetical protein